jgi:hypothetical protein
VAPARTAPERIVSRGGRIEPVAKLALENGDLSLIFGTDCRTKVKVASNLEGRRLDELCQSQRVFVISSQSGAQELTQG